MKMQNFHPFQSYNVIITITNCEYSQIADILIRKLHDNHTIEMEY